MKALQERLAAVWAQAHGVRWDVVASRACGILSVTAGLAPYAGFIPGRTGAIVAGISGGAASLLPRATKAAGIVKLAMDQKKPLKLVLPELIKTLLAGPSIIAGAKAAEADEAKKQAQAAEDERIAQQVKAELTKLGLSRSALSQDVPPELKAALSNAFPPAENESLPVQEQSPALSASVTIAGKAAADTLIAGKAPTDTLMGENTL